MHVSLCVFLYVCKRIQYSLPILLSYVLYVAWVNLCLPEISWKALTDVWFCLRRCISYSLIFEVGQKPRACERVNGRQREAYLSNLLA